MCGFAGFRLPGELESAGAEAETGPALSTEYGFPMWAGFAALVRGSTRAASGELDPGPVEMRRGLTAWQGTGAAITGPEACFPRSLDISRCAREGARAARRIEPRSPVAAYRRRAIDARRLLADATGWFSEGVETSALRTAQQLLQQLP